MAAGSHGLAVGQIKACKLRGFQRINVAWQFVAIMLAPLLPTALSTTVRPTSFRARAALLGTALTISTVVKTRITAWL